MSDASPLEVLERSFTLLVSGPRPLGLHGRDLGGGLPRRLIPLDELRSLLLQPSRSSQTLDAVYAELVRRARGGAPGWRVGLAGMLLPGLRAMARLARRGFPGEAADLEAELLAGLLEALEGFDAARGGIANRLLWKAYQSAGRFRRREFRELNHRAPSRRGLSFEYSPSHPDLALAQAVAAGVVSARDAELIGATRIGGAPVTTVAAAAEASGEALWARRRRAEARLGRWLCAQIRGNDFVESERVECVL